MVRTPYWDKSGLKKGPWTPEEDQILISYIQQHGHSNWRALPKQAGLLRCGKSCRLRWLNYLRPDIKRGNFSKEELGFIMKLHEMMGNKWSVIAAKLPGRTDNEIKNVWHTYLKKRLKNHQTLVPKSDSGAFCDYQQEVLNFGCEDGVHLSPSPQNSSSEISSFSNLSSLPNNMEMKDEQILNSTFPQIGKSCWSSELAYNSHAQPVFFGVGDDFHLRSLTNDYNINKDDCMNFWYNLLNGTGGLSDF